jgi:hypothetical protein
MDGPVSTTLQGLAHGKFESLVTRMSHAKAGGVDPKTRQKYAARPENVYGVENHEVWPCFKGFTQGVDGVHATRRDNAHATRGHNATVIGSAPMAREGLYGTSLISPESAVFDIQQLRGSPLGLSQWTIKSCIMRLWWPRFLCF